MTETIDTYLRLHVIFLETLLRKLVYFFQKVYKKNTNFCVFFIGE